MNKKLFMERDPKIFLEDILDSIALIEQYLLNMTKEDFLKSTGLQDQVVRRLEIIGEAIRHIPHELRAHHPEIPWKKIVGMRDNIIHEYFQVDLYIAWETATTGIQKLKRQILAIKKDIKQRK